MQLSKSTILAIATVLFQSALGATAAAAEDTTANTTENDVESVEGTVNGTALPISDAAVLEAVALPADVYPIITEDAVLFINKTIAASELEAKFGYEQGSTAHLTKRSADANADAAWYWHHYFYGQPFTKRSDEGSAALAKRDANADATWYWHHYFYGQPFTKRSEEGSALAKRDANADAHWYWHHYFYGQPFTKRSEGSAPPLPAHLAKRDADADAHWYWHHYFYGQPFTK